MSPYGTYAHRNGLGQEFGVSSCPSPGYFTAALGVVGWLTSLYFGKAGAAFENKDWGDPPLAAIYYSKLKRFYCPSCGGVQDTLAVGILRRAISGHALNPRYYSKVVKFLFQEEPDFLKNFWPMLKTPPPVPIPQVLYSLFHNENPEEVLLPAAPFTARFRRAKPPGTTPSCGGAQCILG